MTTEAKKLALIAGLAAVVAASPERPERQPSTNVGVPWRKKLKNKKKDALGN